MLSAPLIEIMGLLGSILKTGFDVVTSPIAIVKDCIPGAGGSVDGNPSYTSEKLKELSDDKDEIRDNLEDL